MVRYYKLFDLLNRRKMKKTDLREILSTKTIAKLSKGEYLSGEVIEKICLFLGCQPGDIMEVIETEEIGQNKELVYKSYDQPILNESVSDTYYESYPIGLNKDEAYEIDLLNSQLIDTEDPLKK